MRSHFANYCVVSTTHGYLLTCVCRFLERYKNSSGQTYPDRQGSVTVIRVDGAGVIHDVTPGCNAAAVLNPSQLPDSKADRYSCGPVTIGGKGGGRAAAPAMAGSNRRRHRQAGCFGMLGGDDAAEAGLGPEARYMKEYEARLNPFAEFQVGPGGALGACCSSGCRGMQQHK
jgi:hypothetical protein